MPTSFVGEGPELKWGFGGRVVGWKSEKCFKIEESLALVNLFSSKKGTLSFFLESGATCGYHIFCLIPDGGALGTR